MTEVTEATDVTDAATPLLAPADGLPPVITTDAQLREACQQLANGTGSIAVDAERASGYRYSARAYLLQLRRNGAGTFIIDPLGISDFSPLAQVMSTAEWILHACTQDLGCLVELGLEPPLLFDTEHAGRLLGRERVGLGPLLESELKVALAKEHSAADWSTRPLPESWLVYAALDVELLVELREHLENELRAQGRWHWAEEEFAYLTSWRPPGPRTDPWRRTSGIHAVKQPLQLAVVRDLWLKRDEIAREKDKAPGKVLPDAAIIDIAKSELKSERELYRLDTLKHRGHKALSHVWWEVRETALAHKDLPPPNPKSDAPPPPKAWPDRFPEAAARWDAIRPAITGLAEEFAVAPEVLVSPDPIRRLCWEGGSALESAENLAEWLARCQVRRWQIDLVSPVILAAAP